MQPYADYDRLAADSVLRWKESEGFFHSPRDREAPSEPPDRLRADERQGDRAPADRQLRPHGEPVRGSGRRRPVAPRDAGPGVRPGEVVDRAAIEGRDGRRRGRARSPRAPSCGRTCSVPRGTSSRGTTSAGSSRSAARACSRGTRDGSVSSVSTREPSRAPRRWSPRPWRVGTGSPVTSSRPTFDRRRLDPGGQRMPYLLMHCELVGLIGSGGRERQAADVRAPRRAGPPGPPPARPG